MGVTSISDRTGLRPDQTKGSASTGSARFAPSPRISRQSGVLKAKIIALVAVALLGVQKAGAQAVSLDGSIISDPRTGAALMGYDVVAYFIENRALPGDSARQVSQFGRAWYFSSGANRAAFVENPEAFIPAFGGYDAAALAAGVIRPGDPAIFLRRAGRLYFFRDEVARARAVDDPDILAQAEREWPTLRRDLVP